MDPVSWKRWDKETVEYRETGKPALSPEDHLWSIRANKTELGINWYEAGLDRTDEALKWSTGDPLLTAVAIAVGLALDAAELPSRLGLVIKDAVDIALHGIAMGWQKRTR